MRVAGYDWGGGLFHEVRQEGVRKRVLQCRDNGRREHDVADEPQTDEQYLHGWPAGTSGPLSLRLDGGLDDQHDRDVVFDWIHALALVALQRGAVLDELHLGLAVGAGQNLEQFRIDGHRVVTLVSWQASFGGVRWHYTTGVCVLWPPDVIIVR